MVDVKKHSGEVIPSWEGVPSWRVVFFLLGIVFFCDIGFLYGGYFINDVQGKNSLHDAINLSSVEGDSFLPPFVSNLVNDEKERLHIEHKREIEKIVKNAVESHGKKRLEEGPVAAKTASVGRLSKDVKRYLSSQYDDPMLVSKCVTLTLKDSSVRDAIELIGKMVGFNFLIDHDVTGDIQLLHFKNVPLAIVLRHILQGNSPRLALVKDCGLYRITRMNPAKDLALAMQDKDFSCAVIPLTQIVLSDYQKKLLTRLWRGIIGDYKGKPGFYMLFDEESQKVFCRGRKSHVQQFKRFLQEIDFDLPRIKIEARFVCAEKGFEENVGFQWSGIYNRRASIARGFDFVGAGRPLSAIGNMPKPQTQESLVDWALNFLPTPDKISRSVRLPFVFGGNDLNTKRLNLILNAAEDRHEIKTILKPTVLTNDGEAAEILVGENVPIETIVEESVEGRLRNVKTASYKDIGIQLKVKPSVAPDKRSIILDVFIENSQQTDSVSTDQATYPVIRTTRSHTKVRLRNGQTTMISGLIKDIREKYVSRAPLLSYIPIIGYFFRGSRKKVKDMQLLIFITPTIAA